MLLKTILPQSFDFGEPAIALIGATSHGLDKHAMKKRASAFDDISIQPEPGHTYLHVITTGAMQQYGPNSNGDSWVGYAHQHTAPYAKQASCKTIMLDGGLQKYHDDTYMKNAKVYQQHQTQRDGAKASGFVKAAKYNHNMHRGQLLIAVQTDAWQRRLDKKAKGQDIFLSIGAQLPFDICSICHNKAHTLNQHCQHVKRACLSVDSCGNQVSMLNDAPKFYDISGVDVPADKMAFVIRKVASGASLHTAVQQARFSVATRRPMPLTKAAAVLAKLSKIQKELPCNIQDAKLLQPQPQAKKMFILKVKSYPADQVIAGCNRKGILLTPDIFFKILGKDTKRPSVFDALSDSCCDDCSTLMRRMSCDQQFFPQLADGAFDTAFPADLNLDRILQQFMPDLGVTRPCINKKIIRITIAGQPDKVDKIQEKFIEILEEVSRQNNHEQGKTQDANMTKAAAASLYKQAQRVYARYLISFGAANAQDTCQFAIKQLAGYKK